MAPRTPSAWSSSPSLGGGGGGGFAVGKDFNSGPVWDMMKFDQPSSGFAVGRDFNSGPVWDMMKFDQPSSGTNWQDVAKGVNQALSYAKSWQASRPEKSSISGSTGTGGKETRLSPSLRLLEGERKMTQEQEQRGSGAGLGGALGTLAGVGVALIPGVGQGIAPFLPTIGGTLGSTVGGFFG